MHALGRLLTIKRLVAACAGLLMATLMACGPITEADLQKWSQNEEGLKRITEVMQDADVPFHVKVDAIVILTNNGWANRIRGIVRKYGDGEADEVAKLASAVTEKLIERLKEDGDAAQAARDGIFAILGLVDAEHRTAAEKALTEWAFSGVSTDKSRDEIWEMVSNKIALNQVRDLGHFVVPYALIMIEKRVESEAWSLLNWVDYIFSFYNPEDPDPEAKKRAIQYKLDALEAVKRYHRALFAKMDTDKEVFFDPNDVLIVEKFDMPQTVDYMLELATHPKVDKATQYEALIIGEAMFETLVPEKDYDTYSDRMTAAILQKIPEIRDRTGEGRLKQSEKVLEKSQIQGLKDVPLVVEKEGKDGEKKISFKSYISSRDYHPGKFIYGTIQDFLEPLVDKQQEKLLKEWDAKWEKEQAALKAAADAAKAAQAAKVAEAAKTAGADAAAAAPAPTPEVAVEKPDFSLDPAFITELGGRIDTTVTPLVEDWLTSKLLLKRIFGLAGLKYLGTPKAKKLLEGLVADKTDISSFLGKGITIGAVAANGVKGIEMSLELQQLKIDAIRDKLLSPTEIERLRKRMLADLAITGSELETKYREELKKRQERYLEQKAKLAKLVASYQKAIRRLCLAQIKDYPAADKKTEMERYIENTTISCRKEAEERLTKKKLDFFGFTEDAYRSSVILGIMKKEVARKYVVRLKARAYLKAAVEQGVQADRVQKDLGRVASWNLKDRKLRDVVDKFVEIALGMAKDDHEKSNGERGISPDDIQEYREYLELPEEYVMASILVLRGKLEWSEQDAQTQKWLVRSLVEDAALKAFAPETFFAKENDMVDYLLENYDDLWYALQDLTLMTPADLQSRWGMSEENAAHYRKLSAKIDLVIKGVLDAAIAESRLTQEQADVVAKSYPFKETVAGAFVTSFEVIRKQRLEEEEKARAAEEAKAKKEAPAEAKKEAPAEAKKEAPAEAKKEAPADAKKEAPAKATK